MIANHDFDQRVRLGKALEPAITRRLQAHGFTVTDATVEQDMKDKIDAFIDGKPAQYKVRETGKDMLFDVFEPFEGWLRDGHTPGRDLTTKAFWIVEQLQGGRMVMVSTTHMHSLFRVVWAEAVKGIEGLAKSGIVYLDTWFRSVQHPGVSLHMMQDHKNDRWKLIMFVDPDSVKHIEVR